MPPPARRLYDVLLLIENSKTTYNRRLGLHTNKSDGAKPVRHIGMQCAAL